ncbi:unnamed protein product [Auanema sp. JU1783]|nr:unnamed protein product [Auanema sp. JU1783]
MQEKTPLCVVSTSETMNDVFPEWLRLSYDGEHYRPYDLNMPLSIPKRPISHYKFDPPITQNGVELAKCVADNLLHAHFHPSTIYSSPDLASIQTAFSIISVFKNKDLSIKIEPAISRWRGLEPIETTDRWMNVEDLNALGYSVDSTYIPQKSVKTLKDSSHESIEDYVNRIRVALTSAEEQGKNCLMIADPATLLILQNNNCDLTKPLELTKKRRHILPASVSFNSHKHEKMLLPFTRSVEHGRLMKS